MIAPFCGNVAPIVKSLGRMILGLSVKAMGIVSGFVSSLPGLHPVVTLAGMLVRSQMFGALGLFGVPIGLSLIWHLHEKGTLISASLDKAA